MMEQPSALVLSIIGFGASFGALAMLLVIVLLVRLFASRAVGRTAAARPITQAPRAASPAPDPEARNRARAAAIAVTALLEANPRENGRGSDMKLD